MLVLYGDVPLLRRETLAGAGGDRPPLPLPGDGDGDAARSDRLRPRSCATSAGHVIGVVEEKDASPEERAITEVNAGIYCGPVDFFREATAGLVARNAQGEYYLTDIIARAAEGDRRHRRRGRLSRRRRASTIASSSPRPRR